MRNIRLAVALLSVALLVVTMHFAARQQTETVINAPVASFTPQQTITADEAARVRRAARDLVKETNPGVKMDGVFLLPLGRGNLVIAGVDTVQDGKHRTVDTLVRLYSRDNGATYWRAESLSGEEKTRLLRSVGTDTDDEI